MTSHNSLKNKLKVIVNSEKFTLFVFIIISSFLFIYPKRGLISEYTLDADEILSWLLVEKSFTGMWVETFRALMQPIYYTSLKLWMIIAPENNDYWLRVPSILLSYLACLLISYQIRKFTNWTIASLMFVFMSNLDWVVICSTMARSYPLLLLFSSLNIFFFVKVLQQENIEKYYKFFIATLVLILFTHNSALFYVSSVLVVLFLREDRGSFFKRRESIALVPFLILYGVEVVLQYLNYRHKVSWIGESHFDFTFKDSILVIYFISLLFLLCKYKKNILKKYAFSLAPLVGIVLYLFVDTFIMPILVQRYFVVFYPMMLFSIAVLFYNLLETKMGIVIFVLFISFHLNVYKPSSYTEYYSYKVDYKYFFMNLKKLKLDLNDSEVECVVKGSYKDVLSPYSKMYIGNEICQYREYGETLSAKIILINNNFVKEITKDDLNIIDKDKYKVIIREDNLLALRKYE